VVRKYKEWVDIRAEFFNLFNHVNFANPISKSNAEPSRSRSPF